jgi:enamine deaminase RidA (YjgF/YER057c/UK114 family)
VTDEPAQGVLPAPSARRGGDLIFVSAIYPILDEQVVTPNSLSPYIGESIMTAQSTAVLKRLSKVLQASGSSLDRTLSVEVFLIDPAEFYEFNLVWRTFFPANPPARTTIVVGDEHIVPGCRLNLRAVALATGSKWERTIVQGAGIGDAMGSEHVADAVRAGPFVFASGFPATDFATGLAVRRDRGFPNYDSDAELQARYVIERLERVAEAAGTSLDQAVKVQFYETDLANFPTVDRVWGEHVGLPPTRSSVACRGFLVPGALFVANLLLVAPDDEHDKKETRAGIRWHPVDVRRVNFSPGITAGPWLFTAGQVAVPDISVPKWVGAPSEMPYHSSDIEIQTDFTLSLLKEQLVANRFSLGDVVDARIYLTDARRDFRGFERAWRLNFASAPLPAMTVIPSRQANGGTGLLIPGTIVEIDLISWADRAPADAQVSAAGADGPTARIFPQDEWSDRDTSP